MEDLNAVLEGDPEVSKEPEQKPEPEEKPETTGEENAAPPVAEEAESQSEPDEESGLKVAIAKARERYRMEQERRMELERQLNEVRSTQSPQPQQPPKEEPKNEKPKLDDYEDYDEYVEALADWRVERRLEEREKKRAEKEKQTKAQQEQEQTVKAFQERVAKFAKPDFDQVVQSIPVFLGDATHHAIYTADKGPEIAYYLGQNHQEAAQIAGMSPHQQYLAIGRLEAKLSSDFEQAVQQEVSKPNNLPGSLANERAAGNNSQQVVVDESLEDIFGR